MFHEERPLDQTRQAAPWLPVRHATESTEGHRLLPGYSPPTSKVEVQPLRRDKLLRPLSHPFTHLLLLPLLSYINIIGHAYLHSALGAIIFGVFSSGSVLASRKIGLADFFCFEAYNIGLQRTSSTSSGVWDGFSTCILLFLFLHC